MCAEKIQRFLMGMVLTFTMVLFALGETGYGVILQTFIIAMVLLWAFTDFCPSLWIFEKLFGACKTQENKS